MLSRPLAVLLVLASAAHGLVAPKPVCRPVSPTLYHKDVTGSKVPLLNILIPTPGNLNGSQVPVGHCGNTKTLSAMRLAFCESGGVRFLLNLSLQGSNFDHNENSSWCGQTIQYRWNPRITRWKAEMQGILDLEFG